MTSFPDNSSSAWRSRRKTVRASITGPHGSIADMVHHGTNPTLKAHALLEIDLELQQGHRRHSRNSIAQRPMNDPAPATMSRQVPVPDRSLSGTRAGSGSARALDRADDDPQLHGPTRCCTPTQEEFAAAVADIDKRLEAEIQERQRHRRLAVPN